MTTLCIPEPSPAPIQHAGRKAESAPYLTSKYANGYSSSELDEKEFQKLYKTNYRKVFAICWSIMKNQQDAQDACQETFIRAWQFLSEFRGESAFSTWVIRIALNRCFENRRRFENRFSRAWSSLIEVNETPTAFGDSQLHGFFLEKAKAGMGHRQRLVLSLILDHGLSFAEAACQLRVSRPAISKIVSGIRNKLAEKDMLDATHNQE